ncbi:hypothetical protein BDZ89DRAFT_1076315, partial [Hymenopellis radicata]
MKWGSRQIQSRTGQREYSGLDSQQLLEAVNTRSRSIWRNGGVFFWKRYLYRHNSYPCGHLERRSALSACNIEHRWYTTRNIVYVATAAISDDP